MSHQLLLLPSPLTDADNALNALSPPVLAAMSELRFFLAERERTARRLLAKAVPGKDIRACTFFRCDKDTSADALRQFMEGMPPDENLGLLSEAGCPAVADPGALPVSLAHQLGWQVQPLVGPNAMLLTLMASGFSGQRFTFHGYLPVEADARQRKLRHLERESAGGISQIFMETPYRNRALLSAILEACQPQTRLCIGLDLTAPSQEIHSRPLSRWASQLPELHKRPAVFILFAG